MSSAKWPLFCVVLHTFSGMAFMFNTLRPRQHGRHFQTTFLNAFSLNENVWISIKISSKFVPKGPINNIPALVQIMAWRGPGDKPLSKPMMVSLLTHICVTRSQWVNQSTIPSRARPIHFTSIVSSPAAYHNCVVARKLRFDDVLALCESRMVSYAEH